MTLKGYEDRIRVPYPVGIAYIASYLEKNGVEVKIVDALASGWNNFNYRENGTVRVGLGEEEIKSEIKRYKPDLVGITCLFTTQADNMYRVADLVKEVDKDLPVVVGGAHPSSVPHECLKTESIDYVVRGEGEITTYELTSSVQGKIRPRAVKGLLFKENGKIVENGPREFIRDLDSLPFPAYHLLPMERYFEAGEKGLTSRGFTVKKWVSMVTSRGCPYNCFFCSVQIVSGRIWRARSAKNVVDEIEFLVNEYGIKHIFFEDDNMIIDIKRAENIFDEIIQRGIKIAWETPNGIRADRLNENLLKKMKRSGCTNLVIGIENGNQKFLNEVIRKNLDLKNVEQAVKMITKEGIQLNGFFIIGIPGENERIVNDTINFARKLARMGMVPLFGIATPLPATDMYNYAKKMGYLTKENITPLDLMLGYSVPLLKTEDYSPEDLIRWKKKAVLSTSLELLTHHPGILLKTHSIQEIIKNPLSLFKRVKMILEGTA
jgi:magnesium-protoporphyrin IX monomethyl ester (oxidative) cyclase